MPARSPVHLGLDLGTSGLKALLIDEDQRVLASTSVSLDVSYPRSGWAEQHPADWLGALEKALEALGRTSDPSRIAGIGLSGQMHGAVLLDGADRVLRPCILWNDGRAAAEAARLDADPRFRAITGNLVFPGFTAPKLVWSATHEPHVFEAVRRILTPKDFLRLHLTGEAVGEPSDASGTAWFDVGGRDWSDPLLSACGLDRSHMPRLVEGTAVSGVLRGAIAERLGLPAGIPVAGGAGDNAAAAIGVGALQEGDGFVSLGTSGVLFAASSAFRPAPESAVHAFCHAVPETWHQMGVVLSAMGALEWLARLTGRGAAELALAAETARPSGIRALPYLSGERTPHNDASIRAALTGIDQSDGLAETAAAVLDGVAFALADNRTALAEAGARLDRLFAVGGGARSARLLRRIADATGLPIDLGDGSEVGAAFGAARLAMIAATGADPASIARRPAVSRTVEPREDPQVREAYAQWRELYPALRTSAARRASISESAA